MIPQKYRAYIYRAAAAAGAVLVGYGIVSAEKWALWLGLAEALTSGLAAVNTPTDA